MIQYDKYDYFYQHSAKFKLGPYSQITPPSNGVGGIYLGNFNGAQDIDFFNKHNIQAVLTVAKMSQPFALPEEIMPYHKSIDMDDEDTFDIKAHFKETHDWIHDKLTKGINVFVHCMAGVSRSATIVVSYLMLIQKGPLAEVYSDVAEKRSISPNSGFLDALISFEEELMKDKKITGKSYDVFYKEYLEKQKTEEKDKEQEDI